MGYKKPETVYLLQFEERAGLEVRAASVSMGRLLDISDMAESLRVGEAKNFAEARELFGEFASRLRSWNLEEDDGTPIPCDQEHLMQQEFGFASELLLAWFDAIASVPDPLGPRSTGGLPSVELSLPMEVLSPSLAS